MSKNEKKIVLNKKIKKNKKHGFTLVELIVVITILAILGSIAFVSLQGYTIYARDSVRTTDMRNITRGLSLFHAKTGKYPSPDNLSTLTASGIPIRYQGYAGANTLNIIGISGVAQGSGKDPKTNSYYTYMIDGNNFQYNIIGYYEGSQAFFVEKANASYTGGIMKSMGSNLGMLYENGIPVNEKYPGGTTIDVRNTTSIYEARFNNNDSVIGTGLILYQSYYNRDRYLLTDKNLAKLDDSLVGYWDMETTVLSGSLFVMKDLSKYGNNGVCYDGGTIVNCGGTPGPIIQNGAMYFDGVNDFVQVDKNLYSNSMTILLKIKPMVFDGSRHGVIGYQDGNGLRPLNLRMSPSQYTGNGGFHYDSQELSATSLSDACNTGKRCADNVNYQYDKNENVDMKFYIAYRRKPPFVSLDINGGSFVRRDCRQQPGPNFTDCSYPQVNTFYNFHTDFDHFRIGRVDNFINGTIDEVRVYNRTLSDAEVSALYMSTNSESRIISN